MLIQGWGQFSSFLTWLQNVHWSLHSQIHFHILLKKNKNLQLCQFLNSEHIDPNPGAHSDFHTDTQTHTHKHTDTQTTISGSLCSHHSGCWNIWSDFCQLLSNYSQFRVLSFPNLWRKKSLYKLCAFCRLPCGPASPSIDTNFLNQPNNHWVDQSVVSQSDL